MRIYVFKRVLSALFVMWAVATIVFFAMRVIPSDPAMVMLGDHASDAALERFREQLGLNRPLLGQYGAFLSELVRGNLGTSTITGRSVAREIATAFPYTLSLALASMVVGAVIGIPLGVWTALHRNSVSDYAGRIFALIGFSFPAFYLAVILLLIFSLQLGLFPIVHTPDADAGIVRHLHLLVLPSVSLGLIQAGFITRLTRSSMLENINSDYVRTAYSKGLADRVVNFKHVLRNILIPVVTAMGLYTGTILGGAILTETVFNRPGLGKLLIGAISQRDYALIQSGLMVFSFIIVIVNLMVDIIYTVIDPRVNYE
ncbi:ABC transporter permease [Fodinicurvata sp. EGI_FJ10296]|uniref:ABC transporter permease n=1 Tax=Fodinicurvata sp. EGI_FJ10296 TaxID=3231908 RepID=UPI003456E93B